MASYANFCWDSLLGSFHSRMAKQETENFASVSCCSTRTYRGLTPQFLLGKLAWGLSSVNGQIRKLQILRAFGVVSRGRALA